jgi:hypothetical protein
LTVLAVAVALLVYRRGRRTTGVTEDVPEHRDLAPAGR